MQKHLIIHTMDYLLKKADSHEHNDSFCQNKCISTNILIHKMEMGISRHSFFHEVPDGKLHKKTHNLEYSCLLI